MRAKTDAGTDVWMTEVADAAPGFWAHCWCCVFQLFLMNALWESKGILIFRSHADELVWTSYINSLRETAFKRDKTGWWSTIQFSIEKEELMERYSWTVETMCVRTLCSAFLGWKPPSSHLQPFNFCSGRSISSCRYYSCISSLLFLQFPHCGMKNRNILFSSAVHSLSSLSFCWRTNGSNSQHCCHTRPHMLMVQYSYRINYFNFSLWHCCSCMLCVTAMQREK